MQLETALSSNPAKQGINIEDRYRAGAEFPFDIRIQKFKPRGVYSHTLGLA